MADPSSRDARKARILSHYRLGALIGSGAMGAVHQAIDRRDRTTVAIKLLHPHLTNDESFRERFEREAHVGALLRSPYTVHILDYGVDDDQYFIVMEYVDGDTLRAAMRSGPLPWKRALRIAVQVARALEEAQARGVVHRDIKPENIMLRGNDSVKVTDFGIARQVGGGTLTMPGAFIGTLAYAAPEQFAGKADHRSDIYSLGATLYDMLTGRPPFIGTLEGLLKAIREYPPDMRALAGMPRAVSAAIERCLIKDPDQRYQSAPVLAAALEEAGRSIPTDQPDTALATSQTIPVHGVAAVSGTQPTAPTGRVPVSVGIVAGKPPPIIGTRLGATPYEIIIRNHADRQLELRLTAEDRDGASRFAHASTVSVTPGGTATARLKISPKSRRWRGESQWRSFTVAASGDEGSPPATVDGRFEDKPYGWLPYGGGALAGALAAVVILALLVIGGGGGRGTASAITPEQLGSLVLTGADLGPEYSGFQADPDQSGTFTNEDAIAASCASDAESDQIARSGRISGHRMTHVVSALAASVTPVPASSETPATGASSPQPSPTEAARPAVFLVSSQVDLFEDEEGAAASLAGLTEEPSANLALLGCGDYVATGETVTFQPSGVGDSSIGVEQMAAPSGEATALGAGAGKRQQPARRMTILRFARSNLAGTVTIVDGGGPPQRDEATELASKLDERIRALLAAGSGTPTQGPSPSPQPTPSPTASAIATPTPTPAPPPPTSRPTPPPPTGSVADPATPPPLTDGDGDGVIDQLDQCPNTPPGTIVDSRGCVPPPPPPGDADGDGVTDASDQCPGTPVGAVGINANGCSAAQQVRNFFAAINDNQCEEIANPFGPGIQSEATIFCRYSGVLEADFVKPSSRENMDKIVTDTKATWNAVEKDWNYCGKRVGKTLEYVGSKGTATILWTYEDALMWAVASRTDTNQQALNDWWKGTGAIARDCALV